jgi:hypothetical protein
MSRLIHFKLFCLTMCGFLSSTSFAADGDWGVIPVGQETTISFSAYDITKNFTDQYSFTLQSGADSSYSVAVTFDVCKRGCGNPDLAYGIYDANGGIVSDSGSAVLTSGTYVFQVKGTGMGAGNSVDYAGDVSFMVSAVPEPADILLMLVGSSCLAWAIKRRRRSVSALVGSH